MTEPHAPTARPAAESRRWWVWVPAMGLLVQVVRVWRAFDAPVSHRAPRDRLWEEQAALTVALFVTSAALVGLILAIVLWELLALWGWV